MKILQGMRFGRLSVLKENGRKAVGKTHPCMLKIWECKCDCGKIINVVSSKLIKGGYKSCGCLRIEKQLFDLTGKIFGRLKVEKQDIPQIRSDGRKRRRWICRCNCGEVVSVITKSLTSGKTNSCGKCHYAIKVKGKLFGSYIEAATYLRLYESGVGFEHDKEYPCCNKKIRFDFYIPLLNHYIEVSSFDNSFNNWSNYIKKINKKKKLVENDLKSSFEFINRKHSLDDVDLISKYHGKTVILGKTKNRIKKHTLNNKIKKIKIKNTRLPMTHGDCRKITNQILISLNDNEYKKILRISKKYSLKYSYLFKNEKYMIKYFVWSYLNHLLRKINIGILYNLSDFNQEKNNKNKIVLHLTNKEKSSVDDFMKKLYPDICPGNFLKSMLRYHFL